MGGIMARLIEKILGHSKWKPQTPAAPPRPAGPPAGAPKTVPVAPPATPTRPAEVTPRPAPPERLDPMLETLAQQKRQIEALQATLAGRNVPAPPEPKPEPSADLQSLLRRIDQQDREIAEALQDVVSESRKQTDALQGIQLTLSTTAKGDPRLAPAVDRLAEVLQDDRKYHTAQIDLMEQVQELLQGFREEVGVRMQRQAEHLGKMLWAGIGLLGVTLLVMVIHLLAKG